MITFLNSLTSDGPQPQVRLTVPADGAFVYVLRTTAASLAARLDFTVDEVEDLRIAVGEAASLLLQVAETGTEVECVFDLSLGSLTSTLGAPGRPLEPSTSFAWQVLTTLADECTQTHEGGRTTVTLVARSLLGQASHDEARD